MKQDHYRAYFLSYRYFQELSEPYSTGNVLLEAAIKFQHGCSIYMGINGLAIMSGGVRQSIDCMGSPMRQSCSETWQSSKAATDVTDEDGRIG